MAQEPAPYLAVMVSCCHRANCPGVVSSCRLRLGRDRFGPAANRLAIPHEKSLDTIARLQRGAGGGVCHDLLMVHWTADRCCERGGHHAILLGSLISTDHTTASTRALVLHN